MPQVERCCLESDGKLKADRLGGDLSVCIGVRLAPAIV